MKHFTVISVHQDISGVYSERLINVKDKEQAKDLADAQYLGGCLLVKIQDPKGQIKIYQPGKEDLDA